MSFRPVILTLWWLAYAFMLVHELIPHHHDEEGSIAHRELSPRFDKQTSQKPDWWFAHVHVPGPTMYQDDFDSPNPPCAPIAILTTSISFNATESAEWTSLFVGWPLLQANAPPEPYHYRPLRAPPTFSFVA